MIQASLLVLISLLALGAPPRSLATNGNLMLILDATGSMWGEIEGRPKISVAREVYPSWARRVNWFSYSFENPLLLTTEYDADNG